MKLTETARAVLVEAAKREEDGIGANYLADIVGINCGHLTGMRAGQYAGKLIKNGWLRRRAQWYRGKRGHDVYSHTSYFITREGLRVLKESK